MPAITRMHDPKSLGEYQLFTTLSLVLLPFVTGSLNLAIKSSHDAIKSKENLRLGIQYSLIIFILLNLLLPLEVFILRAINLDWFISYLPLLFIFLLLSSNYQFAMAYLTNSRQYSQQSKYTILKSGGSNFLKLVLSKVHATSLSLIIPLVLMEFILLFKLKKNKSLNILNNSNYFQFTESIKKQKIYPSYVSLTTVISILRNWFPILITGSLYGPKYTGLLGLTFMVVNTPIYPFISALTNVCFGELAQDRTPNKMIDTYKKSMIIASIPSFLGLILLNLLGERIFETVFGSEWKQAGLYAAICFIPIALSSVLSPVYDTLNHFLSFQKIFFLVNLVSLIIGLFVTIWIGKNNLPFTYFLVAFSTTMSLNHIILFLISLVLTAKGLRPDS